MSLSERQMMQKEMLSQIQTFIEGSRGLKATMGEDGVSIEQSVDGKCLFLKAAELEEVLLRQDHQGVAFLQVNFSHGRKILVTESLIGFKPLSGHELELERLPRVVTTPDVQSVFEALHEALSSGEECTEEEILVLRRVFDAVVDGGELVGFDLSQERQSVRRIPFFSSRGCA